MSEENLNERLAALEAVLASFHPASLRVDRDRVMFLAGRASVSGKASSRPGSSVGRVWPTAFLGMTAVAATLLVIVLWQSDREIAEQPRAVEGSIDTVGRDAQSPPGDAEPGLLHRDDDHRAVPKPLPAVERAPVIAGLPLPFGSQLSGKARHDELVRQIAEHGFDVWEPPLATPVLHEGQGAVRTSYGEWLNLLRAEREFGRPVTEWKAFARRLGANS